MINALLAKEAILKQFAQGIFWVYPYWVYDLKEEFIDFPEDELNQIYFRKSKAKFKPSYPSSQRKVKGKPDVDIPKSKFKITEGIFGQYRRPY